MSLVMWTVDSLYGVCIKTYNSKLITQNSISVFFLPAPAEYNRKYYNK
jgi:hypothetical protein